MKLVRTRRLMKELEEIQKQSSRGGTDRIFAADLVDENLFEWNIRLYRVDPDSDLQKDMQV